MIELVVAILILNFILFLNIRKISNKINVFDKPDNKLKKHKSNVPLLGGTILIINFCIFILFSNISDYKFIFSNISLRNYISIFFLLFSFFVLGMIDDKYKLKPEKKFILSIFFSIIVLSLNKDLLITNITFSFYKHSINLSSFSFFFTIFCITILINALNFYDGINGQSSIFFIIIFSYLSYKSPIFVFYFFIIFVLIFILILNLKNKIFMGDNGIYFLGSILIVSLIYEYNQFKTIKFADEILFLLIVPGYDLLRLSITRIYNGKNAFYGDRNHIHHLLINKFSLTITHIILITLTLLPIILFSIFKLNFYLVLFLFTLTYFLLIIKLRKK